MGPGGARRSRRRRRIGSRARGTATTRDLRLDPRRGRAARHRQDVRISSSPRKSSGPLGARVLDRVPEHEERASPRSIRRHALPRSRCARALRAMTAPDTLLGRAIEGPSNLFRYDEMWNRRALQRRRCRRRTASAPRTRWRESTRRWPAKSTACACSRRRRWPPRARCAPRAPTPCCMLPTRFGTGFMLPPALSPTAGEAAFGHPGAGGSLGLADAEAGLAFGYVMNSDAARRRRRSARDGAAARRIRFSLESAHARGHAAGPRLRADAERVARQAGHQPSNSCVQSVATKACSRRRGGSRCRALTATTDDRSGAAMCRHRGRPVAVPGRRRCL